jgi:hypothetical protein
MRNIPLFNFPAFDAASALGRSLGWEVISPAEMDRASGFHETTPATFDPAGIRQFIRRDVNVLVEVLRGENGDAIALLPGWEKSTGARSELALALWAKLEVLDARTFLPLDAKLVGVETRPPQPAAFGACESGLCGCDPGQASLLEQLQELANTK